MKSENSASRASGIRIPGLRWWIAGLLFMASVLNYVDRNSVSLLAKTIQDGLVVSDQQYANIQIAFQVAYAIALLLSGIVVDRLGPRWALALFLGWWSLASLSTSFAHGALSLGVVMFAMGLGEAGNWTAAPKAVSAWFPSRERGLAIGIYTAGTPLGMTVAPIFIVGLSEAWGWRGTFVVTGLLGFVWLVPWLLFYRRSLLGSAECALIADAAAVLGGDHEDLLDAEAAEVLAIESIVGQDYDGEIELVIVNHDCRLGLSENLKAMVEKFTGQIGPGHFKFKLLEVKDDTLEFSGVLDFGIAHCAGDIIVRMDCDDIAEPKLVSKLVGFLMGNKDIDVCGVQLQFFGAKSMVTNHPPLVTRRSALEMPGTWFVNHPGVAIRKQVLMKVGGYGNTKTGYAEDYHLWCKILKGNGTIANLPDVLMKYRCYHKEWRYPKGYDEFLNKEKAGLMVHDKP